jgi:hypothetical protein
MSVFIVSMSCFVEAEPRFYLVVAFISMWFPGLHTVRLFCRFHPFVHNIKRSLFRCLCCISDLEFVPFNDTLSRTCC